jgi:hypothetical protein
LAGRITVDNQPAALKSRKWSVVVMAYDASKSSSAGWVPVKSDGAFEFPDGGIPPGKYVLLFAALERNKRKGWVGPDALKNLYNDPEVNANSEQFAIDHQAPGKTDYSLNLNVAGEAEKRPGPKALTTIAQ